jgi:hypothetical protein
VKEHHPHQHQLTPEEYAYDVDRTPQNQAKVSAHEAYIAANRILGLLDETAEPAWIEHASAIREHAWKLYQELVQHGVVIMPDDEKRVQPKLREMLLTEASTTNPHDPMLYAACPACDAPSSVSFTREEEYFPYGVAPHTVELTAIVDKGRCSACAFEFTDWRAEEAHNKAVQIYLAARKEQP